MKPNDKINTNTTPTPMPDWKSKGFGTTLNRNPPTVSGGAKYIAGVNFDATLDEMLFNRMLRLKNLPTAPQGNEPGKMYWDQVNQKYKLWVNKTIGFVDVQWTSTSTSTTSSSTSTT
jgi:hypothetical protein